VIFLRKERGEEEDPSGEDELGRVGMDDDAGKNG